MDSFVREAFPTSEMSAKPVARIVGILPIAGIVVRSVFGGSVELLCRERRYAEFCDAEIDAKFKPSRGHANAY